MFGFFGKKKYTELPGAKEMGQRARANREKNAREKKERVFQSLCRDIVLTAEVKGDYEITDFDVAEYPEYLSMLKQSGYDVSLREIYHDRQVATISWARWANPT